MNIMRYMRLQRISTQNRCVPTRFKNTTHLRNPFESTIFRSNNRIRAHPSVYHVHKVVATNEDANKQEGILQRILKKIPFLNVHKNSLQICGFLLYESIVDRIDYADFFQEFSLPDTFYSWFIVTELHVWILSTRVMAEGDDGHVVRNAIVQALWTDVGVRMKKMGAVNPSGVRTQISELSEQFQAALIAYDEGLQTNDLVLAGAIWRRMYQQHNDVSPDNLDLLIKYIRKQICTIDRTPKDDIITQTPTVPWTRKS